jgi:alpha-glucoside transport system substrate-binding protein
MTAVVVAVGLAVGVLPGCGDDDEDEDSSKPLAGETVTLVGTELENELDNIQNAFVPFKEATGISVLVRGNENFESEIGDQVDAGNPPDIALFPQPGLLEDLSAAIKPLPEDLAEQVREDFGAASRLDLVTDGDDVLGVPVSADLKSLVWYSPGEFAAGGYEVPTTLGEFEQLAQRMADEGHTPFCLGLESGVATGWPLTDWFEDYLLRLQPVQVYDQWYRHDIRFDDPRVVEVAERVVELLSRPDFVDEGLAGAASRSNSEAGLPVLDGGCMMYRMAHFQGRYWPVNTDVGVDGDVNAFYLPGVTENDRPALTGGTYASAFSDRRAVRATMEYIASERFARERVINQPGFVSPNKQVDRDLYGSEVDRFASQTLEDADVVRYDASDLMPGEVGADRLWDASVAITKGETTVADAFRAIEETWPAP